MSIRSARQWAVFQVYLEVGDGFVCEIEAYSLGNFSAGPNAGFTVVECLHKNHTNIEDNP